MKKSHKEWYSRGYLPHFDHPGLIQMVTFRLADALPVPLLQTLERSPFKNRQLVRRRMIEAWLDTGYGCCCLRIPAIAELTQGAFLHFDGLRYQLCAWVVMPNHVHVMAELNPDQLLPEVLHSWKSFTSKEANKKLGRSGQFWQEEYFDRYIRNTRHYECAIRYIHENPVKAGLVARPEDWPFSSARLCKEEKSGKTF